ncbi:MAG: hypothetical protein Q9185_003578 [Variospora sp. 1 TL-2023]
MTVETHDTVLPIIDLSGYINPKSPEDKERVIAEVRDACARYGFFQVKGHGVSLSSQEALIQGLSNFFSQPRDEKLKLSFLKNPCRHGYEGSGDSLRRGDAQPDSKEDTSSWINDMLKPGNAETPSSSPQASTAPINGRPTSPKEAFPAPVWSYYQDTTALGLTIWEILVLGLGHPASVLDVFAKRPIVRMKMIRYPPASAIKPSQFGVGAHTDFGGVTVLLQQAGTEGLEVWSEAKGEWLPVPSIEDVLVINCGDMIQKWSGGRYKSAKHRVINKADEERLSCATFWHGDPGATNPLDKEDESKDTVGQLLFKRFESQFSLPRAWGL